MYTDMEVCSKLGVSINTVRKLRKTARINNLLGYGQQVDDKILKLFSEVLAYQKEEGPRTTFVNAFAAVLLQRVLREVETENDITKSQDLFRKQWASKGLAGDGVEQILKPFLQLQDMLRQLDDPDTAKALMVMEDAIIKKHAMEYAVASGLL